MKIVVYGICKNEASFADRWMDSMGEADKVVVLDTGSEDGTAEKLKKRGAVVAEERIVPWRFDTARNRSLELVDEDADICVCTDLDEVFVSGWRNRLEKAWSQGTTRVSYRYTWSFLSDGREGVVFWIDKIHSRKGYRWSHPVHEVLEWTGEMGQEKIAAAEGIQLNHFPDPSKSRGQYLELLELSVKESPEDDRNMHYLGREYLYRGRWNECIAVLKRHLAMPAAVWKDERAASMRYIARAYAQKGERQEARNWYLRAIAQAPYLREPYLDLAFLLYEEQQWDGVLYFTGCALEIKERPRTYISEAASWGSLPYDLRGLAYYYTGRLEQGLALAREALSREPGNERLKKNVKLMEQKAGSREK